jgi:uncharacterized protein YodC (DUF2158 family)
MSTLEISLGSIVTLHTHPYSSANTKVIILGDHQTIPPLMVVVEILNETKTLYDEHTGNQISDKNSGQCKCIWYSTKSNQFEEAWLSKKLLKIIETNTDPEEQIQVDSLVAIKTLNLEYHKQKSSVSIDGNTNKSSATVTQLLTFVSPIMQVLEIKKHEDKETKYDSKSGLQRRFTTQQMVKCKWYNPATDKMSEKLIPIEALMQINLASEELLQKARFAIDNNKYYNLDNRLIKPSHICYRSGHYTLKYFDYIHNKFEEEFLTADLFKNPIENPFLEVNVFEKLDKDEIISSLKSEIAKVRVSKNYITIKYKNINDEVTTRTLKNYSIEDKYLQAFCHLRNEERTFHLDRVQDFTALNLSFK